MLHLLGFIYVHNFFPKIVFHLYVYSFQNFNKIKFQGFKFKPIIIATMGRTSQAHEVTIFISHITTERNYMKNDYARYICLFDYVYICVE
jgi:hypothetical protein